MYHMDPLEEASGFQVLFTRTVVVDVGRTTTLMSFVLLKMRDDVLTHR